MRERWGALSVRDHVSNAPLVTEVLLYDRLIVPVPDPDDNLAESNWHTQGWQPELLHQCLDLIGVKTDTNDGLALTVPWGNSKRARFRTKMSMAAALATQQRNPEQGYYMDPFDMTRELVKNEFRPALPPGVSKAWILAAYSSAEAYKTDGSGRATQLALSISHHFLAPKASDPDRQMLKRAVDLANTDAFRHKRARFYEWQEEIIENDISTEKAIEELEQRLLEYNKATKSAFGEVLEKYVFTVIPIGLGLAGAVMAGPGPGLLLAGTSGLVELARFWKFDRKPVIDNGDLDAAAMVHDARKVVSLQ